ncbi:DUF4961 domain-containing protein [Fulvivirgaceae bacterium BMA10]|uniref:DUF4961 domain-containing protein n=1 Tax=Splendidivirga corallicola TaxID=3051826 RepID=A0ABT8KV47_9BACT|nr:DUF4961 domain-containing protein [Fulvivirgaceae bacterium BMA10]
MRTNLPLLATIIIFLATHQAIAQIVTISPGDADGEDLVKVIFDVSMGNAALVGATKVYIHSGLVTDSPNGTAWQHVIGNWGEDDGVGQMSKVEGETDKWEIDLDPSIRAYHQAPEGTNVFRLAMVFRNADGSKKGAGTPGSFEGGFVAGNGDIYIDLNVDEYINITAPDQELMFLTNGESFTIQAQTSNTATNLELQIDDGSGFSTITQWQNTDQVNHDYVPASSGQLQIKLVGEINGVQVETIKSLEVIIRDAVVIEALPGQLREGINYNINDPTRAHLVLLAPGKEFVYVLGDFNNWEISNDYLMKQTPDGEKFWLELTGLTSGQEYIFQYWVDGIIKIGDPYADKVADPYHDKFIPATVYPDLIAYTREADGLATVLQTGQMPYAWGVTEDTWQTPAKEDLVIYELLVRDFIGSHDYKDLADTLSYLKRLGVNAIELMPVMEFEGNDSWGYNPSYFLAPDKYYGTKNDLKAFIEKAHAEGFAVILDMVLNHAFGQNPMVCMYWDEVNNKPSTDSPWFNPDAKHPFNVGFDFNHESDYTRAFVDSVNRYWIEEYHFDGFRFDLSKGFTQKNNPNDVAAWSAFDQSRIDILSRMAQEIWSYAPSAYVILEHFADASEESVLTDQGMLVWNNVNYDYGDVLNGNTSNSFSRANALSKISYMESHDEDRLIFKMQRDGQELGTYDVQELDIALNRVKAAAAFFYTLPGPKMLWQFHELGYDIDIEFNGRTGVKPQVWGEGSLNYYKDEERQKLYKSLAAILQLTHEYEQVFDGGNIATDLMGDTRRISITHQDLDINIIGNFSLKLLDMNPVFSKTGTWYDFFSGEPLEVTETDASILLSPGEFHIYTDKQVFQPEPNLVEAFKPIVITEPGIFSASEQIKIIFDATQADPDGTAGLIGAEKVYMHSGVILDAPDGTTWENTIGNLGLDDGVGQMTKVAGETDKWEISFVPREYYGVAASQRIYRLAMCFRDANNTNVGKGKGGKVIFLSVEIDSDAQIVTVDPVSFNADNEITITFDATSADAAGTQGLLNSDKVYMHAGVITDSPNGTSWTNVIGNWGSDDGVGQMTKVEGETNKWQITLVPRNYFNVPSNTPIYRLGMVFRNGDGSREGKGKDGTDIFVDVEQIVTSIDQQLKHTLNVYPNPSKGRLHISPSREYTGPLQVQLIDLNGKVLKTKVILGRQAKESEVIDVSNFVNGIYLLSVMANDKRIVKKVFIEN